jgi:glycosyltransferase involved in cell wall biosynthesis
VAEISNPRVPDTPNIGRINIKHGLAEAAELLAELGVFHVHVHHLFGYPQDMTYFVPALCDALGSRYDFTFHDHSAVCPRINMIDATGVFCDKGDLRGCESCIEASGSPFGNVSVGAWRANYERFLRGGRRLFAPDEDIRQRIAAIMPGLEITLRPHPETVPTMRRQPLPHVAGEPLRVAVIGNISAHKGSRQLQQCAEDALRRRLPISFVVFGHSDAKLNDLPNIEVTGRYPQEDLQLLLAGRPCHLAFLPSVCPESYSYVLSEAFFAGLYPVAFDLGAPARRIRECGWGLVLPFAFVHEPGKVNDALLSVQVPEMPAISLVAGAEQYSDILADYYGLTSGDVVSLDPPSAALRRQAQA